MASDFHVPCRIICSRGAPWLKALEAPPVLNAWNVNVGEMLRAIEELFRFIYTWQLLPALHITDSGMIVSLQFDGVIGHDVCFVPVWPGVQVA